MKNSRHFQGQRHLQGPEAHPAPRVPPGGGALEGGEDHGGGGHAAAGYEAAHILSEGEGPAVKKKLKVVLKLRQLQNMKGKIVLFQLIMLMVLKKNLEI